MFPLLELFRVKMGRCFGHGGGEEADVVAVYDGILVVDERGMSGKVR